jgi:hypothetical protein
MPLPTLLGPIFIDGLPNEVADLVISNLRFVELIAGYFVNPA